MPGFAPILGARAEVLILGSMPSRISLTQSQYYANPRNAFWRIMSQLYCFDENLSYAQKAKALSDQGVAVWDVLYDCVRPGSLDSAIVRRSEIVNDFDGFVGAHPELQRVIFNGAAAEQIFRRHCLDLIRTSAGRVEWLRCPSTSPAHASISIEQKITAWQQAIEV